MKLGLYMYHLNTFNIANNEGANEWAGGGGTKKPLEMRASTPHTGGASCLN